MGRSAHADGREALGRGTVGVVVARSPTRSAAPEGRAEALGRAAVGLVGVGAGLVALDLVGVPLPPCPFRTLTGVPCPGCGTTRLAAAVASGDVGGALATDAPGLLALVALAAIAAGFGIARLRGRPSPIWLRSAAVPVVLALLAGAHWIVSLTGGGFAAT